MTKDQLRDKIKEIVKVMYNSNKTIPNATPSSLKYSEMLSKFPKIEETLSELMSQDFTHFVEDIIWIAPRPSTFKVILKNQNSFIMIWNGGSFNIRVSGKTYDISAIGEKQRAIKSIQEILITGPINPQKDNFDTSQNLMAPSNSGDMGGGGSPNFDFNAPNEFEEPTPESEPEIA